MTPWQFRCRADAYSKNKEIQHNHDAWVMWHGAALTRMKKMTPLKDFYVSTKKSSKSIDEGAIMARLKAYKKRVDASEGS